MNRKTAANRQLTVSFLGPLGTYSHDACTRRYGAGTHLLPCPTFNAALACLQADSKTPADVALLPVENSIEGPVTQTLDQLAHAGDVTVTESFCLSVRHCLLACRGTRMAGITTVYSHPQPLAQASHWLTRHLPRAEQIPAASTADAARRAAAEPGSAAIAGRLAGRLHGLVALASDMRDAAGNTTRFLAVTPLRHHGAARDLRLAAGDEHRALLFVILPNRPGALLHALQPFQTAGLNLSFIQSRPLPGRPWEYGFFIEVQVEGRENEFQAVCSFLGTFMEHCRILGHYAFRKRPLGGAAASAVTDRSAVSRGG